HLSGCYLHHTGELSGSFPIREEEHRLDLRCGNGGCIHLRARQGSDVTHVASHAEQVRETEHRVDAAGARAGHGLVSDAAPLLLSPDRFHKVICTEVMEHVDDPAAFRAELVRVAKPGAQYLLSVPAPASEAIEQQVAPSLYFEKPHHLRIFSRDAFHDLITASGLVVEKQTTYGFFWSMFWAFFWSCDQDLSK